MTIRPLDDRDLPKTVALTNTFIRDTAIHFGSEDDTVDSVRRHWHATRERFPWLVAELDGAFAGFARAGVWRARDAYRFTAETAVYVEQTMRSRGAGAALYSALLDELRQRGFHTAIGGVTLPNDASLRLHEKIGFTHVGTVRQAGWKLGRWWDVSFWQATLTNPAPPAPTSPSHPPV